MSNHRFYGQTTAMSKNSFFLMNEVSFLRQITASPFMLVISSKTPDELQFSW